MSPAGPGPVPVRMGEIAVSATPGDELLALGLGSCIGLAVIDRRRRACGLAHIVLPESSGAAATTPARFADAGVPALIAAVIAAGGRKGLLEAVIAGGAAMFGGGTGLDVGARNDAAIRELLRAAGIPIVAEDTLGDRGRTVRVTVAGPAVTVRESGGAEVPLLAPAGTVEVAA